MIKKNALLLAAVSVFALTLASTTNAAYRCSWSDGVKLCGNELGFAPSAGGESDRRDQHSGDHDSSSDGSDGGSGSDGGDGSPNGKDDNNG